MATENYRSTLSSYQKAIISYYKNEKNSTKSIPHNAEDIQILQKRAFDTLLVKGRRNHGKTIS